MKRSDDFVGMVDKAPCADAKKTVAMNYVNSLRPLENGSAGSVKAQSASLIALAPMMLEMYLHDHVSPEEVKVAVDEAVAKHAVECKAETLVQSPLGKSGVALGLVKSGGWPVAAIWLGTQYSGEIKTLISSWCQ